MLECMQRLWAWISAFLSLVLLVGGVLTAVLTRQPAAGSDDR